MPEDEPAGRLLLKLKMDWGRVRIWGPNQEELAEPAGRECRVRAAPSMGDVQPVRPTARGDRSAAQSLRGRRSGLPLLEHAQELAARGPAGADVEVPESEVRALGVAQEDPPLERQALARGVGDGVAQPGVLQEGGVGEGVAAVQHDFFGPHFG